MSSASASAATVSLAAPPPNAAAGERRIPGHKGIWVGIACELVEFSVLFIVYFVARAHFPEAFAAGSERLNRGAGLAITLCLVSSSFCVAAAVATLRADRRRQSLLWLGAAVILAFGYPAAKIYELNWNLAHGIDGGSGIFFTVYYYLTFNHLVHAGWGILGMLWVLGRHLYGAYTSEDHAGLEALGSYWHATDMIWLVLFSFFYVLA